jgi:capsular polysaccharide transport system permease protein
LSENVENHRGAWGQFVYEIDEGLRRQANVIFALIFKEFRTKSTHSSMLSLLWVIAEPGVDALVLSLFWYLARRQTIAGINVALFLVVSFMGFTIIKHAISSVPRSLRSNESFYAFQQVKPFDSIAAQFILEWTLLMMGSVLVLFLLYWFFGLGIRTDALLQFTGVLAITSMAGFGISLLAAVYSRFYTVVAQVLGMSGRLLLFVSIVLHDGNDLPSSARAIVAWNPIAHMEEYLRYYALGVPLIPEASFRYMTMSALCFLFFGFVAYYANRLRLMQQ